MRLTAPTVLYCPTCHGALASRGQSLTCPLCARTWPIIDGVPAFGGRNYRDHGLTLAQRQTIADTAATCGWQVAVHTWLRAVDPRIYRQAIDEYRAHWRFILPLDPSSKVLDLSSDWGAAALNLAESCGWVVAAEACPARARFIALRAQQMACDNLTAVQLGLDQPLPFAEGSFDAVVLVDALARLPEPWQQRQLLRRVHAILRPGGVLLLADPNSLSLRGLAGGQAPGRSYSVWGYQQLLRRAQFHTLQTYALLPSHLEPFFIVPLDHQAPFAYFLNQVVRSQDFAAQFRQRGHHRLYRLVRLIVRTTPLGVLARLARPFVPSIALVARA